MKRFPLSILFDVLFYAFSAWLLLLCVLRYFRLPYGIALAVSLLVGLAVGGGAFLALSGKNRKRELGRKEQEERDALLLHLALERQERVRLSLLEAFAADGREAHCEGEELSVDGEIYLPLFTMEPLSADAVAALLRKFGSEPFKLVTRALSPEAERLLASFGRSALCGDEVYALFTRTGTLPSPLICGEIPRRTPSQRLKRTFSKSNARPFFVSGALLLVFSLFTLFPVYYIVTGAVLLGCAVTVRLFGFA